MSVVFLLSVVLKGVGALLEVLLQVLITREMGVSGYGTYAAWINAADLVFWVFFSGLVKCNTFYLSGENAVCIHTFKKRYYLRYVFPLLTAASAGLLLGKKFPMVVVLLITGLELLVLDRSSTLLARGRMVTSLVGEYVLGRLVLVAGVIVLTAVGQLQLKTLLILYLAQYVLILSFFLLRGGKTLCTSGDISDEVSLKKWTAYQQADLMHAMIEQMPVVVQYFFVGAFETGVVSIVLLVKKLINFISGPTAKVFLPEFSRLYHAGDRKKIYSCYAAIMRIQMLIVGPMAVVLLGYPRVVLGILAGELVDYAWLFMLCAVVFLLSSSLGPCGGILQMTGNEKTDNRCRMAALLTMVLTMVLTGRDPYFVLYGLCAETLLEAGGKYAYVCRWMEHPPVRLGTYLKWWFVPCLAIAATYLLGVQSSFVWMLLMAGGVFVLGLVKELGESGDYSLGKFKRGMEKRGHE